MDERVQVDSRSQTPPQINNICIDVHVSFPCSDGVGRSGTFAAVYSLLERVKAEQVLDVFQAIKVLRLGRPDAVKTLVSKRRLRLQRESVLLLVCIEFILVAEKSHGSINCRSSILGSE